MPISGIIFTVIGIVLLITVHWAAGAACLVIGLALIGYALSQRGKATTPSAPESQ